MEKITKLIQLPYWATLIKNLKKKDVDRLRAKDRRDKRNGK